MAKKLVVKTDVGTFDRRTERTYTHIVVVKGYRAEILEASRLAGIAEAKRLIAQYSSLDNALAGFVRTSAYDQRNGITASDTAFVQKEWAKGSYTEWKAGQEARLAELEATGPITEDGDNWRGGAASFGLLGWTGRLDLALKLANTKDAQSYRDVRVYALDGTRVR